MEILTHTPILTNSTTEITLDSSMQKTEKQIAKENKAVEKRIKKAAKEEEKRMENLEKEEKKIADEQERVFSKAFGNKRKKEKDKDRDAEKDIYLDETLNILNDWIDINRITTSK